MARALRRLLSSPKLRFGSASAVKVEIGGAQMGSLTANLSRSNSS